MVSLIGGLLGLAWQAFCILLIARCLLSFCGREPYRDQVSWALYRLTEPALVPVRRLVPPSRMNGVDVSPLLLMLVGGLVMRLLTF